MTSKKIIQSYVWHKNKCYFVSTITRDSSAVNYPYEFNETIVWEYDYEKRIRGKMLFQDEDFENSIEMHNLICNNIFKGIKHGN
jgi:hypothetical protein